MAPRSDTLYAVVQRISQDLSRLAIAGQYIGRPATYLISPSKLNTCVVLVTPMEGVTLPLTSWVLTQPQVEQLKLPHPTLGTKGGIADYGLLLYSIYHSDDIHELQTLADRYIEDYKVRSKERRYREHEEKVLASLFYDCDSYAPDDDELWKTEDASTCIGSAQLRDAAGRTLTQLEMYA